MHTVCMEAVRLTAYEENDEHQETGASFYWLVRAGNNNSEIQAFALTFLHAHAHGMTDNEPAISSMSSTDCASAYASPCNVQM